MSNREGLAPTTIVGLLFFNRLMYPREAEKQRGLFVPGRLGSNHVAQTGGP
jgi:hypothetical protein